MALSDTRPATPRWSVVSAALAPALLGLTWLWMEVGDPQFRAGRDTISDLGAHGAPHGWVISLSLILVGACNVASAVALTSVARAGRVLLAIGGVAGAGVGLFRNPSPWVVDGTPHSQLSAVAFVTLAVWPLFAMRRQPGVLRPRVCLAGSVVLGLLLAAFVVLLDGPTPYDGLAERIVVVSDTLWTLLVAVGLQLPRLRMPARPEAMPARPEAMPARPEALSRQDACC